MGLSFLAEFRPKIHLDPHYETCSAFRQNAVMF
jgi:hypothetical protein